MRAKIFLIFISISSYIYAFSFWNLIIFHIVDLNITFQMM